MTESISQASSTPMARDPPPHMEDSIFDKPTLEISDDLSPVSSPVFDDEVPDNLSVALYKTDKIPGLFAFRHVNQMQAKSRIITALSLAFAYLRRTKLTQSAELTRSTLKKPRIHEVVLLLDGLFEEFQILHDFVEIKAMSPKPEVLASITRKLSKLREEARDYLVENGSAVPKPPLWGKNNDPEEWLNANDFEILSAAYRHEVEGFLRRVAPYFPKPSKTEDIEEPEPRTPPGVSGYPTSVSELPALRKTKTLKFEEIDAAKVAPIPSITSQGRLATLLNDELQGNSSGKINAERNKESEDPADPFSSKRTPKEPKENNSNSVRPPPGPPSDSSDSDTDSESRRPPKIPPRSSKRPSVVVEDVELKPKRYHFDLKLKPESVPQWNGNPDVLARWISKVNRLANNSPDIRDELGKVVPRRFTDSAETWYYSIPDAERIRLEENWSTLKKAISEYWMNHHWLEKQKLRANRARYRESGHQRESPSDYIIRKMELLSLVYSYTDSETIQAIMQEVPDSWASVINPQYQKTIREFQNAVKYHEESLEKLEPAVSQPQRLPNREYSNSRFPYRKAHVNLVGWSKNVGTPQFPKDDKNVSPRKTPESIGARPCRHCGSGMHWDNECRHSRKGERMARVNLVRLEDEDVRAQEEYDSLFYELDSDTEGESTQRDFCRPLQRSDFPNQPSNPNSEKLEDMSRLEGTEGPNRLLGTETIQPSDSRLTDATSHKIAASPESLSSSLAKDLSSIPKIPLNRNTRRRLAREIAEVYHSISSDPSMSKPLVELKKHQARPPGCSFLGSQAAQVPATFNSMDKNLAKVIVDSGSDITLISQKLLTEMLAQVKLRQGQKINLVQVTGNASISGYVDIDLYFHTPDGPVKINVEAYVVKGMSTPFILGNDFADQYSISVIRKEGNCFIEFGDSDRRMPVNNSVSPPFIDEEGHAFKLRVLNSSTRTIHRKNQRFKRKTKFRKTDRNVRSSVKIVIPPETSVAVPVLANFPSGLNCLYVEKVFSTNRNPDDVYAPPDSLILKEDPKLHVANFSATSVTIQTGQILGIGHNPNSWLDRIGKYSPENQQRIHAHARVIRTLAESRTPDLGLGLPRKAATVASEIKDLLPTRKIDSEKEDIYSEPPVEGGPKVAELPEDRVDSERLIEVLDINPELPASKRKEIQDVIVKNQRAFGLDDRLGHLDQTIKIPLKPDAKEISLPPFHASPTNREVIDKQMDKWIQLGVIEPSKSPWAAPAFIVYRNGKPRMVVDYRKLNEIAISDEFPLPKQEDILQALEGSQWLSTLDALAGFTQLEIEPKEREKLAFRTHRGLWQFVRMPFGYKNGPSIFQRIMQNVLAPFLWIFALVYIDDIVIFSLTFEDHISHLDQVFQAIEKSGVTLAVTKCHFGYQSLLLLGQKVSRLGLSTHKEKVDAVLELEEPKNCHDLQVFLGMMVYFSAYIPFYAWIAGPLFNLLRKSTNWEWTEVHSEAFELCKQVLVNAPVRGYAKPGFPYRLYSDACDFGLAAILQQVQRIQLKDLKGTKAYERCEKAFKANEPIPSLVVQISKLSNDVPENGSWAESLDDTWIYIERVIAYWSRVLKPAERNYSPTEREALALKEGLIKFQPYIEGESILAVTDHAALTWSKTFQNVNRRLLTWGTVFAAYPRLQIVHRAGRVHSNVDPISRLRRRIPYQQGPTVDATQHISLELSDDPLKDMYDELGDKFEEKLLNIASKFVNATAETPEYSCTVSDGLEIPLPEGGNLVQNYATSSTYSVLVGMNADDLKDWKKAYTTDHLYSKVLKASQIDNDEAGHYTQYQIRDGLVYFEDWNGNFRLCVPESLRVSVMSEVHNILTESAHGGHAKTYNRIASTYYWPRMSRDIKRYVSTCDICQKSKPKRHAPFGLLQPIPIPTQPFEVVSMDFIPELPLSDGFDNIFVIVDKLTKYAIFIPTTTTIGEKETAELFFHHVISKFGIPRQVISDRDTRWRGNFWKEICDRMGMARSLTTAYHPQADGQTEVLNQSLEISLRAYVGPSRDDWAKHLDALSLSYNSTPHTATGFAPAYLLRGYTPVTGSTILHSPEPISRPLEGKEFPQPHHGAATLETLSERALEMTESFNADRHRAQEALMLGQHFQKRAYNQGRLALEFDIGDLVLLNPHSLSLLKNESGRGKKLLMKYDGPFEIIQKLSPVSYRLRMPGSYGIHPILNIAHLEKYQSSPTEFGERPVKNLNREDFNELPEYEVERIITERKKKGRNGRRIIQYLTRFKGYSADSDEWLTQTQLRNAPEILEQWNRNREISGPRLR